MNASRLYPKTYKGKEESGGYIATNDSRKGDNSPHYRGRIYLEGIGWFWLSGWHRDKRGGEMISLSCKPITDDEAEQYCAPRETTKRGARQSDVDAAQESLPTDDGAIPF